MGCLVTAGPEFVPGAVAVAHRDDVNRFGAHARRSFLVVVRADRAPALACDLAIAQNPLALATHERFVPLWPQPGLLPRSHARAYRVERLAYQGRTGSVPEWFADRDFHHALSRRGVSFDMREQGWHDYRRVDLVLAMRDEADAVLATKPATKVYNGWHAGVPVLAGPEPAYRALRENPLDFLEVATPRDVLDAVDRLQDDPALYAAMVRHGRRRAAAYSVESIRLRWLRLFESEVLPRAAATALDSPLRAQAFLLAMARQKVASRIFRGRVLLERSGFARYSGSTARTRADRASAAMTARDVMAAGVATRWWIKST